MHKLVVKIPASLCTWNYNKYFIWFQIISEMYIFIYTINGFIFLLMAIVLPWINLLDLFFILESKKIIMVDLSVVKKW